VEQLFSSKKAAQDKRKEAAARYAENEKAKSQKNMREDAGEYGNGG
jgi:hypothetical protein